MTRTLLVALLAVGLAGLGAWRLLAPARPTVEGAEVAPPSCGDPVALSGPGAQGRLVCLSELHSELSARAAGAGCVAEPPEGVRVGDRVTLLTPKEGLCEVRVAPLEGASLLALGLPLDLNRARAEDLEVLPGIGPTRAQAIVAHREGRGGFGQVADLLEVKGIGPATLERLGDTVVVHEEAR